MSQLYGALACVFIGVMLGGMFMDYQYQNGNKALKNTKVTKSKESIYYEDIKTFYNNRLIQLRTEQINHQQYRDSLYLDLETFMIKNK